MAKQSMTKGELAQVLGIKSPVTLVNLISEMEASGVMLPSEGEGRNRRFYRDSIKLLRKYRETRERKPKGPRPKQAPERVPASSGAMTTREREIIEIFSASLEEMVNMFGTMVKDIRRKVLAQ